MLCVCVCSSVEGFGLEAEARMTTWHVMMSTENENDSTQSHDVSEGKTQRSLVCGFDAAALIVCVPSILLVIFLNDVTE